MSMSEQALASFFASVPDDRLWSLIRTLRGSMRFYRKRGDRDASHDYLRRACFWIDELRTRKMQ